MGIYLLGVNSPILCLRIPRRLLQIRHVPIGIRRIFDMHIRPRSSFGHSYTGITVGKRQRILIWFIDLAGAKNLDRARL
jgi:hypothetical protein